MKINPSNFETIEKFKFDGIVEFYKSKTKIANNFSSILSKELTKLSLKLNNTSYGELYYNLYLIQFPQLTKLEIIIKKERINFILYYNHLKYLKYLSLDSITKIKYDEYIDFKEPLHSLEYLSLKNIDEFTKKFIKKQKMPNLRDLWIYTKKRSEIKFILFKLPNFFKYFYLFNYFCQLKLS